MYTIKKQLRKALETELTGGINELNEKYQAVQLLPEMKKIYPTQLRKNIVSLRIYQTKRDCYLEITEQVRKKFDNYEAGNGFKKNFVSERVSLKHYHNGESYIFNIENPIIENALVILDNTSGDYDYFFFDFSSLFTKKGYDQLCDDWNEKAYLQSLGESDPVVGEFVYSIEQLNQMDGYSSVDDPESLDTPFMYFEVDEGNFLLYFYQHTDHTDNNPFEKFVNPPDLVECSFQVIDKIKNWYLKIPLFIIKLVTIESKRHYYEEYNITGEYSCIIDITEESKIEIKGDFEEFTPEGKSLPESWFFIHKVNTIEGS